MDKLTYSYDEGNRLLGVSDAGNKEIGFKQPSGGIALFGNGTNVVSYYDYDVNGNLVKDATKGGIKISYNHLNLPIEVDKFSNYGAMNVKYIYAADGTKQRKIVNELGTINRTDYSGGYIYRNGKLEFIRTEEGYAMPSGSGYRYVYEYKDHLGNIRLSYTDANKDGKVTNSEIIEENNYYPFGLKHKGYNTVLRSTGNDLAQKYKYNGKELNEELGLNWYDYGARNYQADLGRWFNMDPLAEKYFNVSPYNYCVNNPIRFIDPDGQEIVLEGTQAQMQQTLSTLQKLTSDQLTVNYNTGVVKIPTLSTGGNLPIGTALIRELNSKLPGAKTVVIDYKNSSGRFPAGTTGNKAGHMPSPDATNGVGVDAFVTFDPTSNQSIVTKDPATGNAQKTKRPNEIGLGHELIHAQHYMTGTKGTGSTSYTYKDTNGNMQTTTDKTEEVNTVGLGGRSKYTENMLRKEQRAIAKKPLLQNQLNPRVKY